MYRYYCILRPPMPGAVPYIEGNHWEGRTFTERRYIHEIERMAWGWWEYENPLTPAEIADYELIAAPREDE